MMPYDFHVISVIILQLKKFTFRCIRTSYIVHQIINRCGHCEFSATTPEEISLHEKAKHDFPDNSKEEESHVKGTKLKKHKDDEHKEIIHTCGGCDFTATTLEDINWHIQIRRGTCHRCYQCDFVASSTERLEQHKKNVHNSIRYHCDQCDFSGLSILDLGQHRTIHILTEDNLFANVNSLQELGLQSATPIGNKVAQKFSCDECYNVYSSLSKLKKHKECAHAGVRFNCDQCKYVTSHERALKRHTKRRHSKKAHIDKAGVSSSNHFKLHQENIGYHCDQCDFSGTSILDLSQHRRTIHIQKESYLPSNVGSRQELGLRGDFTASTVGNKLEQKFSCDECKNAYSTAGNLKQHKQAKHEGILYNCEQCEYVTSRKNYLLRHKKNMHKNSK